MILWIWEYFPTKFLDLPVILKFVYVPTPLLSSARLQSTEFNSALLKQGASKVRLFPRPLQIFRPSCSPLYMYRHPANFSPSTEHKIQLHCWNRVLLKSGCSLGPFRFLDLPTALCICTDAPAQFSPSSEHRNSTPLLKQGASKVRLFPMPLQIFRPSYGPLYNVYVPTPLLSSVRLQSTEIQLHCWNRVLLKSGCSLHSSREKYLKQRSRWWCPWFELKLRAL